MTSEFFWLKPLAQMSPQEWESLCDGCGRCCLIQLEDEDTQERLFTDYVCRFSNLDDCSCDEYAKRNEYVPHCVHLSPENVGELEWMPQTCSYRVLHLTGDLPSWHPLKVGNKKEMEKQGISVQGKVRSELEVQCEDDWFEHIIKWVD